MNIDNTFSKTVDLLHRSMSAESLRRNVYAHNLANAASTGFKRTEVTFESELGRALDTERRKPALKLTQTHPDHISNWQPRDYQEVQPRRVLDWETQVNNNGNNVDIEQEVSLLMKNQMRYALLAQMTSFEFNQVSLVLRG